MLDCGSDLDLLPQQPALLVELIDCKVRAGIDRLNIDRQPTGEIEDRRDLGRAPRKGWAGRVLPEQWRCLEAVRDAPMTFILSRLFVAHPARHCQETVTHHGYETGRCEM